MDEAGAPDSSVMTDGEPSQRAPHTDHEELVRARSAELTRLAYLVTGDRERAIDIVATALVGLRDEWSEVAERGTPQAEARAAVVRRLLPGRRRNAVADGPAVFAGTDADRDWTASGEHAAYGLEVDHDLDAVVLQAYAAEPVSGRVAIVLHELDHLDSVAIAMAGGTQVRSVDRDLEATLDRVGRARFRAAEAQDRDRPTEAVDAHLRRVLVAESARAGLPLDLTAEVAARRGRTVRRRRLLTAGAGGLGLALAGAIAGPALLRRAEPSLQSNGPTSTGTTTTPDGAESQVALSWDAVWQWPARGSMVNDPTAKDFVRQQRQRVIYAERVNGVLLVVGARHDENAVDVNGHQDPVAALISVGLIGRDGVANGTSGAFGIIGTDPLGVTTGRNGPGRLVVLAPPQVASVDISRTVRFDPTGSSTRVDWEPLQLAEGVGQVASPAQGSFGMTIRYAGRHYPPISDAFELNSLFQPVGVTRKGARWDAAKMVAALTRRTQDVAGTLTGLAPSSVSVAVRPVTDIPGNTLDVFIPENLNGDGAQVYPALDTTVVTLIATLPGGARLRTVAAWHPNAGSTVLPSVLLAEDSEPYPATGLEGRPIVLQASGNEAGVGIIAPAARSIRLTGVQLNPGQKATIPVTGGLASFGVTQWDDSATITTLDAKGRRIGTWPFHWGGSGNPWDLYG